MRKQTWKSARGVVVAMVMMAVYAGTLAAQGPAGAGALIGSWDVLVTARDCETGAALPFIPVFPAVMTYDRGGTMQETDLGGPFVVRLPGQGVWAIDTARTYTAAFRYLNFAPDRTFIGTNVVRSSITLEAGGDQYTSVDTLEVLDPAGNVVAGGCATTSAKRFK